MSVDSAQESSSRRDCYWELCISTSKDCSLARNLINGRAFHLVITVASQVIGSQTVQHDNDDIHVRPLSMDVKFD